MSTPALATPASPSSSGLDVARLLVQKVSRTFYGSKGAILVDQLVQKEAFRDEELGKRLGMPTKEVSKLSHRLVQDDLVQLHRRSELKPGAPKASLRTYYYLDFARTVDVIKWRMYKVQQTIDVKLRNELDAQGYLCPLCKASYAPLDAAALYDPTRNLLACSICQTEVTNNENDEQVKGNKDRMQRLNRQTKSIVDLLKKLERVELPRFDVERYLAVHGPALGATAAAAAAQNGTAVAIQPEVKVHIAGDDDEAIEKAKRELELKEKRAQNMLPSWIAQSTIDQNPTSTASEGPTVRAQSPRRDGQDDETEQGIVGQAAETISDDHATTGNPAGGATSGRQIGSVNIGGFGAAMSFYEEEGDDDGADGDEKPSNLDDDLDAYYASLEAQNLEAGRREDGSATPGDMSPTTQQQGRAGDETSAFNSPIASLGTDSPAAAASETPYGYENELGTSSGKRSRQGSVESESRGPDEKKFKLSTAESDVDRERALPVEGGEDEDDEGAFDQVGDDAAAEGERGEPEEDDGDENMDPDQLVSVNGTMLPYSQVTEDMTSEMTADEYSAYWDVYARLNE
ncbi:hypothetical protein JCM3766R1_001439 [Sporobolomyces carnicolor]